MLVVEGQKNQRVDVTIGQPTKVAPPPPTPSTAPGGAAVSTGTTPAAPPEGGGNLAPAWISLAVGGVGIAVGSIFGAMALGTKGTLSNKCDSNKICPSTEQSDINALSTDAIVSDIGFGVGVVGLGLAAYFFLTNHGDEQTSSALHVTPYFAGNGAGLTGTFR
jgi:hypothetical protein